jgi:hypothetical protein
MFALDVNSNDCSLKMFDRLAVHFAADARYSDKDDGDESELANWGQPNRNLEVAYLQVCVCVRACVQLLTVSPGM